MENKKETKHKQDYLVSVIIATYRRENKLFDAINSLVNQSYNKIEIIVVDDNFDKVWNEKVLQILNNFNDKRIKYLRNKKNLGSAKARNVGIKYSCGEYVTFLDDDDIYTKFKVERQLNEMIENKADFSITDISIFNANGQLAETRSRDYIIKNDYTSLKKYHMKFHLTGTDSLMFKREYLLGIGLFPDQDTGDEYYLMDAAIEKKGVFVHVPFSDIKAYLNPVEEGLSSSIKRLYGEEQLLDFKRKDFNLINLSDQKFILMRYYIVIAYIYYQQKNHPKTLLFLLKSLLKHPIGFIKTIKKRKM